MEANILGLRRDGKNSVGLPQKCEETFYRSVILECLHQQKGMSATFVDSHSHGNEKSSTGFDIQEFDVYSLSVD